MYFFTVIIVSLNAENTISRTIQSVLNQTFSDYEIVIKDGNSTDSTLTQIPKSNKVKVYQQQDTGVFDAMNQAINFSNGKYLCFLNCGDIFASNEVLQKVFEAIAQNHGKSEPEVLYCDYRRNGVIFRMPKQLSDFYLFRTPLNHQSMYINSQIFKEFGIYDNRYSIMADYEHTLRIYKKRVMFLYGNLISCDYLGGGLSEAPSNKSILRQEYTQIRKCYYTKFQLTLYSLVIFLSCMKVREMLISDNSPKLIRLVYRGLVNMINRV